MSFTETLETRASPQRNILLALVDMGAYEMAVNFYETSLRKFNISSYIFLSTSSRTCELLENEGAACLKYGSDEAADRRSEFMSKDFVRKMNIRTGMILRALRMGYHVLHSDVDVVYYRNPFDDLPCRDGSCDVATMWDDMMHNAGFLYVRSTPLSVQLYEDMEKLTNASTVKNDQTALNEALHRLSGRIRNVTLDTRKYACGKYFYEPLRNRGNGLPAGYTDNTVVVHNNWIAGIEAKIYRFKEMLQWHFDEGRYYTDPDRTYITYSNSEPSKQDERLHYEAHWEREKLSLQNALMMGALLNRTVILPEFHCNVKYCSLLSFTKLKHFDAVFGNKYREHLFLTHPKVPRSVSQSLSVKYSIETNHYVRSSAGRHLEAVLRKPVDLDNGPVAEEILHWFGKVQESVLRFTSLEGDFANLKILRFAKYKTFAEAFEAAFVKGSYRQY